MSPSCISVFIIPQLVLILRHMNPFLTLYSDFIAIHLSSARQQFSVATDLIYALLMTHLTWVKNGASSLHDYVSIKMTQTAVNRLAKRVVQCVVHSSYLLNLHLFDIRSSVFSAQLPKLWCRFTYWLIQPCTGLPVNKRKLFRVIEFRAIFFINIPQSRW